MAYNKSVFEAREISPGYTLDQDGEKKYTGPERRKGNRRSGSERRTEVRFEINKQDRRQAQGRRKGDKGPKFW
jgi:hypothetical protein